MTISLGVPDDIEPQMKPRITVIGVGGAGGNAVNNMIEARLEGVEFVVANTDAQALAQARTDRRIQLGGETTHGLGSGARPDIGRAAAEESYEAIASELKGSHMCFITAGMGGGTGTGAAPVAARCARDMGILTVGVVTKPFQFEGSHRMRLAEGGIEELSQYVDTLIIIPNQNLFRVANEKTTFADAFKMADNVLYAGVRSVTDLMIMPGLINLDFADVRTVMMDMGRAMMGTGEASGDNRAIEAAEAAIANPLLEETSMRGARGVLINITGGNDLTLYELDEAANRIREEIKCEDANVIFGSCLDSSLDGTMRVSVVASGIDAVSQARPSDSGDAAGSGFGLGLAAASKVAAATGGADRAARAPASSPKTEPATPERPAAVARQGDDLIDPSMVLGSDSDGEVRPAAREAHEDRAAPAATAPAPRPAQGAPRPAPREVTRPPFRAQPGSAPTPANAPASATGHRAFIPQPPTHSNPAQAPASAPAARLTPGVGAPPGQAFGGAARDNAETVGQVDLSRQVHGQTALDPRYAERHAAPSLATPAPRQGQDPQRGPMQPGLRAAPSARSGDRDNHPDHGRAHEHGESRRERPSLFQRMTGFGRARAGEEERDHGHGHHLGEARHGHHGESAAPGPMRIDPEDRPVTSHQEDQLEIPAFLRRQAN
jgi:cell division protein FtsZ